MIFLEMDYTRLFYWLTVADNAKLFFAISAIFFGAIFAITQIVRFVTSVDGTDGEFITKCNKWTWYSTPIFLLFLSMWIFTPSKRDSLLIIAGGETMNFVASDESAKQIPKELTSFVVTELKNMALDAKVNLNINSTKQEIADKIKKEAENMNTEQLLKRMNTDSIFRNILLNN